LVAIVGEEALTELDKKYLQFADEFERRFISQGDEDRDIETTFGIGWDILSMLPEEELKRIKLDYIQKYHPVHKES
jgi:V/A-type H+-transporting ATPase subunit B